LDISDGTLIRLGANTVFKLVELSPAFTDPITRLRLDAGKVWVWVTTVLGLGSFEVETPVGVAGVRGSLMSVEYDPVTGQMIVTCLDGECRLTGSSGTFIDLTRGQQSEIGGAGQDPTPAHALDNAQLVEWAREFPEAQTFVAAVTALPRPTDLPPGTPTPIAPGATEAPPATRNPATATAVAAQAPASEDLIAYYPFDGDAADLSGNGNHGTVFGATLTTDRFGRANSAYHFDGVDDFIDLGNGNSLKPPLPMTIAAWVKLDAPDPNQAMITNSFQAGVYWGVDFNISDGKVTINYLDGGAPGPASRRSKIGTTVLGPEQWYHVVGITRDSTDMDIYVNGTNDGGAYDGTGDAIAYNDGPGVIGKNALFYFHGVIDDIQMYNRALSEAEILQLFRGVLPNSN
jgi:hypothetical protein